LSYSNRLIISTICHNPLKLYTHSLVFVFAGMPQVQISMGF